MRTPTKTVLDAATIREGLNAATRKRVASLEVFSEIASTNSYLMEKPEPPPSDMYVAVTTNQTAGRGRRGRRWLSPPGSGLCLSMAYTFTRRAGGIAPLTLAIGLGAIKSLQDVGVHGVFVKWPNDLIAGDGKLGGILTEAKTHADGSVTVVTGLGLNLDLGEGLELDDKGATALPAMDLCRYAANMPAPNVLSSCLLNRINSVMTDFERAGFALFAKEWAKYDWLRNRKLVVETLSENVSGIGAGIARDGALLLDTGGPEMQRITSGTVVTTGEIAT